MRGLVHQELQGGHGSMMTSKPACDVMFLGREALSSDWVRGVKHRMCKP